MQFQTTAEWEPDEILEYYGAFECIIYDELRYRIVIVKETCYTKRTELKMVGIGINLSRCEKSITKKNKNKIKITLVI